MSRSTYKHDRRVRAIVLGVLLSVVIVVGAAAWAAEGQRGAAQMVLDGGNRGAVAFPHQLHQDTLQDCALCHSLFPMESGIIDKRKAEGQLAKKEIMNKLCIKCHKATQAEGRKSGPLVCSECHSRG